MVDLALLMVCLNVSYSTILFLLDRCDPVQVFSAEESAVRAASEDLVDKLNR